MESCPNRGGREGLHRTLGRIPHIERIIRGCPDRYMITLTTKRRLDEIAMSAEVAELFHRVNTSLFGTHYSRKSRMMLATVAVQERSINQGLHTHILVGVPEGSLSLKAHPCLLPVPTLITTLWTELDERGRRTADAQDARDIFDFDGAIGYITKTIRSLDDLTRVDWLNTITPDVLSTAPSKPRDNP